MQNNNLTRKSKFVSGSYANIWHLKVISPQDNHLVKCKNSFSKHHKSNYTSHPTFQHISPSFLLQFRLVFYSTFLSILFFFIADALHNKNEYYLKRFISDFHLASKNWKGNFLFAFWTVSHFWQPVHKQRVLQCSRIFWIDCSNVGE